MATYGSFEFSKAPYTIKGSDHCEAVMYWDAKVVKPLSDYRIYVEIEDGRIGVFDMKHYLNQGVFRKLRNMHYFNQVSILFGAVTWPDEQDIAPETLVDEMTPPCWVGKFV